MYKVNMDTKKLERVETVTFNEIKCKERQDLQEWIVSNPTILGEELLIIQKEFDGFDSTHERLDLLALDKQGNVVVIENKLDDTGRDVVWQAVKYASYCSTMTSSEILEVYIKYIYKYGLNINAEQELLEFFEVDSLDSLVLNNENSQRIILVSRSFRAEVLSAVSWLLKYGLGVACVKVIPYKYGDDVFIDAEQILPQKQLENYMLKIANKAKETQIKQSENVISKSLRNRFWLEFMPKFNEKSKLFENISYDRTDHWLGAGAGMATGIAYNFLTCKNYCGVELCISNDNKEFNKVVYDILEEHKQDVENNLGFSLSWEKLEDKKMSRVIYRNDSLSLYNEESWAEIQQDLSEAMIAMHKAFSKYNAEVKQRLYGRNKT